MQYSVDEGNYNNNIIQPQYQNQHAINLLMDVNNNMFGLVEESEQQKNFSHEEGQDALLKDPNSASNKRFQVKRACKHCKKNHAACDNERPCKRCVKHGVECVDVERKKRETKPKIALQSEIEKARTPNAKRRGRPKKSEDQLPQTQLVSHQLPYQSLHQQSLASNWLPSANQPFVAKPQILESTYAEPLPQPSWLPASTEQQNSMPILPFSNSATFQEDPRSMSPLSNRSPISGSPTSGPLVLSNPSPLSANSPFQDFSGFDNDIPPFPIEPVSISPFQSWVSEDQSGPNKHMRQLANAWGEHQTWTFPKPPHGPSSSNNSSSLVEMYSILNSLQSRNDNLHNKLTAVRQQLKDFARENAPLVSSGNNCFNESTPDDICISVWRCTKFSGMDTGVLVQCNHKFVEVMGWPLDVLKNNFTCHSMIPSDYPHPAPGGVQSIDKESWPKRAYVSTATGTRQVCMTLMTLRDLTGKITHIVSHLLTKEAKAARSVLPPAELVEENF